MKLVGLVSGGKDSCFNMMHCVANGHEIVALANLYSEKDKNENVEIDSYMYQTVGTEMVIAIATAMDLPLYRQVINGKSVNKDLVYDVNADDEVEDLYLLLQSVKKHHPDVAGVSVGAILSDYQRTRVENVCQRLQLQSFAYLWQQNQSKLLQSMVENNLHAVLVKVAAMGLNKKHLKMDLAQFSECLNRLPCGDVLNPCGEGGEYETVTVDCPLFKKTIRIDDSVVVTHSDDDFAPVLYLKILKYSLIDKPCDLGNWKLRIKDASALKFNLSDFSRRDSFSECASVTEPSLDIAEPRRGAGIKCFDVASLEELDDDVGKATKQALRDLANAFSDDSLKLDRDAILIQLFVKNMADFAAINAEYSAFFGVNPPARVCVQVGLKHKLQIVALAKTAQDRLEHLHVQSISYWAPANIGPYSQRVNWQNFCFLAGQIGMIPSSLAVPFSERQFVEELEQSLSNVQNVALQSRTGLVNMLSCICYVTNMENISAVRNIWNERLGFREIPLVIATVEALPKNARVEWQPLLHLVKSARSTCCDADCAPFKCDNVNLCTYLGTNDYQILLFRIPPELLSEVTSNVELLNEFAAKLSAKAQSKAFAKDTALVKCFYNDSAAKSVQSLIAKLPYQVVSIPCKSLESQSSLIVQFDQFLF